MFTFTGIRIAARINVGITIAPIISVSIQVLMLDRSSVGIIAIIVSTFAQTTPPNAFRITSVAIAVRCIRISVNITNLRDV